MGDKVILPMEGASAVVLAVTPAKQICKPLLFNATGTVAIQGGRCELKEVSGEIGSTCDLVVAVPKGEAITAVTVNGKALNYTQEVK